MPFWETMFSISSGCQRFGSVISAPGSFTTSGSFTGW